MSVRDKIDWKLNIGSAINFIAIVAGILWATATFTAEARKDQGRDAETIAKLEVRVEKVQSQMSDIAVLKNDVMHIRESMVRIERALSPPPR